MAKNRKTPDMNLPVWFDGQNINEALFCEEFLHERRIIFANGAFFTPDGRVTDDLPLRGEIYDKLKFCAVNNIPRKITNILEVLKLEAQVPDFPPEQDRIHVFNGNITLTPDECDTLKRYAVNGIIANADNKRLKEKLASAEKTVSIWKQRYEAVSEKYMELKQKAQPFLDALEIASERVRAFINSILIRGKETQEHKHPAQKRGQDMEL